VESCWNSPELGVKDQEEQKKRTCPRENAIMATWGSLLSTPKKGNTSVTRQCGFSKKYRRVSEKRPGCEATAEFKT